MRSVLLLLVAACGFPKPADVTGGGDDDVPNDARPLPKGKSLSNFRVLAKENSALAHDLVVKQSGTQIDIYAFAPPAMLIAAFDTDGQRVTANGEDQVSDHTSVMLRGNVTYIVTGDDGTTQPYNVNMHARGYTPFQQTTPIAINPKSVAFGDLDGDGFPDAVIGTDANTLVVFRNVSPQGGPIGFEQLADVATPVEADALAIGDLDNNGVRYVVMGSLSNGDLTFYKVMPGGTNTDLTLVRQSLPAPVSTSVQTTSLAIGNIFGSGYNDIMATTGSSSNVFAFHNKSGLVFAPTGIPLPDSDPIAATIVDFDHDGSPDLAYASFLGNDFRVLLADKSFNPSDAVKQVNVIAPTALAVGHVAHDDAPELFASTRSGNAVILLKDGSLPSTVDVDMGTDCVAAGDLDNDGVDDVIPVFAAPVARLDVFIQGPGLTFVDARQPLSLGKVPVGCAAMDLNNDGIPDLIVAAESGLYGAAVRE